MQIRKIKVGTYTTSLLTAEARCQLESVIKALKTEDIWKNNINRTGAKSNSRGNILKHRKK